MTKKNDDISFDKPKRVEEFRKPDEPLMTTAIESNTEESMIWDMEAEGQAPSTFSFPAKLKLITAKS